MPAQLRLKLSTRTGTAGNQNAQANPNESWGKYISTTLFAGGLNGLISKITGDENATQTPKYGCLFVENYGDVDAENTRLHVAGPRITVDAETDVFTTVDVSTGLATDHGLTEGMAVRFAADLAGDALPGGIDNATTYYLRDVTAQSFKIAASAGGVALDITSAGSGTNGVGSVRKYFGAVESVGVDPAAASAIGSATAQAAEITAETNAPAGVTFSEPVTRSGGVNLGTIPAGQCRAFWLRVTPQNSAAFDSDGALVRVSCDTAA